MKTNKFLQIFLVTVALLFGLSTTAQVTSYPHTSDFEGSLGDWVNNTGDDGDWSVDANGTPSSGTGPAAAQTGNYYIFTETSSSSTWGGQIWLSCKYDFSSLADPYINFWYHKYSANGGTNGPGSLGLDVFDGTSWNYDVFRDDNTNGNAWKNANVDLSAYAGRPNVILSWTNYVTTPQGWQCDIALDNIVVDGTPACAGATLDYTQDFETGSTNMTGTNGTQSQVGIDATSANASLYGLHLQGNTSSYWYTPYTTGAGAFGASPQHIATASREICASTDPSLTLTFDIKQTYSYNANYCWFRLTVDGTPVTDDQGNVYYNASSYNGAFKTLTYDLSAYANMDFTVAWEGCMKYYDQYYKDGDNIFIDNISLTEKAGGSPPGSPGAITGFIYPNADAIQKYRIDPVTNATSYTWTVPSGWSIDNGQGSEKITVTTSSTDGNVTVYASNSYGNSNTKSVAVKSAEIVKSFPDTTDFDDEAQHSGTANMTGFVFVNEGFRNVTTDDGDWRADRNGTGSVQTGPGDGSGSGQPDQNGSSTGYYLYVESSSPNFNSDFALWSPPYDLSNLSLPAFTFWYSMYGSTMGTLSIQASGDNGKTWSSDLNYTLPDPNATDLTGDQGMTWQQGFIDLKSYTNETQLVIRFSATTGSNYYSDFCIDNVQVMDMATTGISIGGDIDLSSSVFDQSGLTVTIIGSSPVLITSNSNQFNNLVINNSGGVTLGDNLDIENVLTLTKGCINASGNLVIVRNSSANSLMGGNSTSFIYGGDLRRYTAPNTGTYAFPIGQGSGPTNYFRADLINNLMNLPGSNDFVQMSVGSIVEGGTNQDGYLNTSQDGTAITHVNENAIWTMTPSMGGAFLSGNYGLNFYVANLSGLTDNKFTIVKRPTGSTNYNEWDTFDGTTTIPAGGSAGRTVASGYAQKLGFTSFSEGGSGGSNDPLPVSLLYFTAEIITNEHVKLQWETVSEQNNDRFEIERSSDGIIYDIIGIVDGNGNTNESITYIFNDRFPSTGFNYYRFRQVDYDGNWEYSNTVAVKLLDNSDIPIYVYDILGRNVYIGVDYLPQGIYIFQYEDGRVERMYIDNRNR